MIIGKNLIYFLKMFDRRCSYCRSIIHRFSSLCEQCSNKLCVTCDNNKLSGSLYCRDCICPKCQYKSRNFYMQYCDECYTTSPKN